MADQRITSYVKSCMGSGIPLSRIRSDLYKAGWQKNDIEEAIASVTSSQAPAAKPTVETKMQTLPGPDRKKFYIGIIIIIAVVGIGTFYFVSYILYPSQEQPPVLSEDVCGDGNCTGQETYEVCPQDCPAPPVNQNVTVSVNPASRMVSAGETVNFDVSISGIQNLYGFQFDVEFYPGQLSYSSAAEGTFLNKNGADQTFCIPPKASAGTPSYITIACTRLGQIGGVSGSGQLATITFSCVSSGTVQPVVKNVKLVDYSLKTISLSS